MHSPVRQNTLIFKKKIQWRKGNKKGFGRSSTLFNGDTLSPFRLSVTPVQPNGKIPASPMSSRQHLPLADVDSYVDKVLNVGKKLPKRLNKMQTLDPQAMEAVNPLSAVDYSHF